MDRINELIEARDLDSAEALIPLMRDGANAHDAVTLRCLEAVIELHRGNFDSALTEVDLAPPLGGTWSPGVVWCAVGLEIRDPCCGDWPTGRDCFSDGDDANEFLQSSEVIAVSSVEIEVIGVRGRGDQQVCKSAPRRPSFADDGGND